MTNEHSYLVTLYLVNLFECTLLKKIIFLFLWNSGLIVLGLLPLNNNIPKPQSPGIMRSSVYLWRYNKLYIMNYQFVIVIKILRVTFTSDRCSKPANNSPFPLAKQHNTWFCKFSIIYMATESCDLTMNIRWTCHRFWQTNFIFNSCIRDSWLGMAFHRFYYSWPS